MSRAAELERMLAFALAHDCSNQGVARIDGDVVLVPVDWFNVDQQTTGTEWHRASAAAELHDVLGY